MYFHAPCCIVLHLYVCKHLYNLKGKDKCWSITEDYMLKKRDQANNTNICGIFVMNLSAFLGLKNPVLDFLSMLLQKHAFPLLRAVVFDLGSIEPQRLGEPV